MNISGMIKRLEEIKKEHGDLEIEGGYLGDDRGPSKLTVINEYGCDIIEEGGEVSGVFIE